MTESNKQGSGRSSSGPSASKGSGSGSAPVGGFSDSAQAADLLDRSLPVQRQVNLRKDQVHLGTIVATNQAEVLIQNQVAPVLEEQEHHLARALVVKRPKTLVTVQANEFGPISPELSGKNPSGSIPYTGIPETQSS